MALATDGREALNPVLCIRRLVERARAGKRGCARHGACELPSTAQDQGAPRQGLLARSRHAAAASAKGVDERQPVCAGP